MNASILLTRVPNRMTASSSSLPRQSHYDIVIAGGGMVGVSLAVALAVAAALPGSVVNQVARALPGVQTCVDCAEF